MSSLLSLPSSNSSENDRGEEMAMDLDIADSDSWEEYLAPHSPAQGSSLLCLQESSNQVNTSTVGDSSTGLRIVTSSLRGTDNKVILRTKSDVLVLDDGYKWRKYGKKMMKNSPNPRNYYRCSNQGCGVKKRIERQLEDSSYVITTYQGAHNHDAPSSADRRAPDKRRFVNSFGSRYS